MLEVLFAYERDFQVLKLPVEEAEREAMLEFIREQVLSNIGVRLTFAALPTGICCPTSNLRPLRSGEGRGGAFPPLAPPSRPNATAAGFLPSSGLAS